MAKHMVKCSICGVTFDTNEEPYVKTSTTRYAHKACKEKIDQAELTNAEHKEKFENYVKQLFGYKTIPAWVTKQINKMIAEYGYDYLTMWKALTFFYEVEHGDLEKAHGGVGIIPFVVDRSEQYWNTLAEARAKNIGVKENEIITATTEITISTPLPCPVRKKRKLFAFLDKRG